MGVVTVFQGATAAIAAPTLITDGVPLWKHGKKFLNPNEGFVEDVDEVTVLLYHTAYVSGVPSLAFVRAWGGYMLDEATCLWVPLGTGTGNTGTATDKGRLNAGAAIDGNATKLFHAEKIRGISELARFALEVGTVTGSFTFKAQLYGKAVR